MTEQLPCGCRVDLLTRDGELIPVWEAVLLHGPCQPLATVRPLHPLLWEGDQA